ncbi:MFS transporter [Novosphingobium terrae]|uniref:MFS transporter n=1 Tax=Novosphingobium terrae TaxID=2726189 RepID=UPI00197E1493|nr:MFS transporter [Novosphingobium terrae]
MPHPQAGATAAARPSVTPALPTLAMAVATGMGVANIYYNQPMLGLIEREMPGTLSAMLPMVTQLGYAAGLVLLVPLGDLLERRRLIVVQFLLLAGALALLAMAPNAAMLLLAAAVVGAMSTVAQQIVPFAAHLASPEKRGAVVGTVMSGLLCGILLSRTLAGIVGGHAGWRAMFALAVPLSLLAGALMRWRLPHSKPDAGLGYGALLASMEHLWLDFPALRLGAISQGLVFGSFSAFWSILALHLQEPRFGLGAGAAGLFGVIGLVGVAAAPLAGRVADKHGPRPMIVAGALVVVAGWVVIRLWDTLAGMVLGVIALDFGVQIALISNQHIIFALKPEARSRINTIFMAVMFVGGALGSAGAAWGWAHGGWPLVALIGLGASALAAAIQLFFARKSSANT